MIITRIGGGGSASLRAIAEAIGEPAGAKDKKEQLVDIINNAQADIAELCNERGCSIPVHPTFPQIIGGISKLIHFTKPAQVSGLRSVGNHDTANKIDLFWTNPAGDTNFRGIKILYRTGSYPTSATDGTVAYDGTGTSAYLTNMAHGTTYYFRAFSYSSVDGGFVYNDLASGAQCTGVSTLNASAQITGLKATVGSTTSGYVKLTWANPSDSKFKGVRILYKTGGYPSSVTDGTVLYTGTGTSVEKTGLANGTTYYFRAFAYNLSNNIYSYNTGTSGAQCSEVPFISKGEQVFTASGTFTVPARVSRVDVFLVGGGGGGSSLEYNKAAQRYLHAYHYGNGGGSGYTKTVKGLGVTPGQSISVVVGAGGAQQVDVHGISASNNHQGASGNNGGDTSFGGHTANGGQGGPGVYTVRLGNLYGGGYPTSQDAQYSVHGDDPSTRQYAGQGGSGGGSGGYEEGRSGDGRWVGTSGSGGTNGSNGTSPTNLRRQGGKGQGTTTRAFGESSNTLYASGGAGGVNNRVNATANTGNGGNGRADANLSITDVGSWFRYGGSGGGSGIVIVRWGY